MPETKPTAPLNNALARLVIEAIKRSDGFSVPESTLKVTLGPMIHPPADEEDFRDTFLLLLQRDILGFKLDDATQERLFFLRDKGENYASKR